MVKAFTGMAPAASKLYIGNDVSLLMVLLDTNPNFWAISEASSFGFSSFLSHFLGFLNSILQLNQLNQLVVIATGHNSCGYIYDSSEMQSNKSAGDGKTSAFCSELLQNLEAFMDKDEILSSEDTVDDVGSSLLSGSLSMAICCKIIRYTTHFPFQVHSIHSLVYVAVMNAIFSGQRSMVPIDSCVVGSQHSPFLQQLVDGLFQYLSTLFATDLHSRSFLQLPKPVGVDFRASCFCHTNIIDMGYICSVCLSIFCEHHKKCSACGSVFAEAQSSSAPTPERKKKLPEAYS